MEKDILVDNTNLKQLGALKLPRVIIGTSSLGNLYQVLSYEQKLEIIRTGVEESEGLVFFDTAGKYGAGLALEILGKCLKDLGVKKDEVVISNKLGWLRMPLKTKEPTFEQGVWKDLDFDAYQNISYEGILACFEQGNELLGNYSSQLLSVHDPDEYLAGSIDEIDRVKRFDDIKEAYRALNEIKESGKAIGIGVGAKDWKVVKEIEAVVKLDWVMLANSMTLYDHPRELIEFIGYLKGKGILIINSAVFNGGFLTGSNYFNYQLVSRESHPELYSWRDEFYKICDEFEIKPAEACVCFALKIEGISSIALNSSSPRNTKANIRMGNAVVSESFWQALKAKGLIDRN